MKEIPLTRGRVAIVDDDNYDSLSQYKWHFHDNSSGLGYAARTDGGRVIWMHRVVNATPDGFETDHLNHDRLDNRKENLRTATSSENRANRQYENTCGFRGVQKDWSRWRARIRTAGRLLSLGTFLTPEEAARAYDKEASRLYGNNAILNFPDEGHGTCLTCGCPMQIVRPGKWQCPICG